MNSKKFRIKCSSCGTDILHDSLIQGLNSTDVCDVCNSKKDNKNNIKMKEGDK